MRKRTIGERPSSRTDLAGWYAAALEAQRESGLSVAQYARELRVSVPTLYQWRRRLGSGVRGGESETRLVEVTEAEAASDEAAAGIELRINDGRHTILVPRGFDREELRRLVEALESC